MKQDDFDLEIPFIPMGKIQQKNKNTSASFQKLYTIQAQDRRVEVGLGSVS